MKWLKSINSCIIGKMMQNVLILVVNVYGHEWRGGFYIVIHVIWMIISHICSSHIYEKKFPTSIKWN